MADFNTSVPSTPPTNFSGWSKPIQGYAGNKAGETLLKGVGQDIDEFTKDANSAVKDFVSDDVQTGMQKIRDDYRNRLQTTYNDISGQPLDILPKDSQDLSSPPPDMANRISNRLDTLSAARQSGKYSDTHIDMEYEDFLKETRSKYPGYRDWVDEVAAKSMGRGEPANAVIRKLTGDINSYSAQAQKNRNDINTRLGQAAANGDPEATAAYSNRNNMPDEEKTSLLNRKDVQTARVSSIKQTRDNSNNDPGLRTSAAFAEANQRVSDAMTNFVHTFTSGGATTEQLIDQVQNNKASPEDKAKAFSMLGNYMQIFKQRQIAEFNKVDPKTGRSLDQDLGGKTNEIVDKQMAFYSSFRNWLANGNGGPVAATAAYAKAMDSNPTASLMKGSIDQYTGTLNRILKDNPNGNSYLSSVQIDNNNINPSIKAAADSRRFALASGTDYNGKPNPMTVNQVIQDAKNDNLPSKVGDANARSFFSNVVGWHRDLYDKANPSVQANMANAMYGPGSEGVLKHFPADSSSTKGKSTVFNQWFSPAMDKTMFTDVGKKDGNLLSSYIDRKKSEFGNAVLPSEMKTLNGLNLPNVKWSYDNETHQLAIHGYNSPQAQTAVNRLNIGLASIASLAKFTREDANGMLLHWFANSGIEDGPASAAIKKALKSSFLSPKKSFSEAP